MLISRVLHAPKCHRGGNPNPTYVSFCQMNRGPEWGGFLAFFCPSWITGATVHFKAKRNKNSLFLELFFLLIVKSVVDFAILICIQLQLPDAAWYSLIPLYLILIYTHTLQIYLPSSRFLEQQQEKKWGHIHTHVCLKSYLERN